MDATMAPGHIGRAAESHRSEAERWEARNTADLILDMEVEGFVSAVEVELDV